MGKEMTLLQAVQRQQVSVVQKIIGRNKSKLIGASKKVNVNFQDQDGMSALHQAALVGNVDIMKILLDNGARPDVKDIKGMRAIHYASWQGNVDPVGMLLKCRSDPNEAAYDGLTPLHLACEHGHFDVIHLLLNYQGDPTRINHQHKTPFELACEFGRYRVVELLIHSSLCNVLLLESPDDMADSKRATCIHLAARNGHIDVIHLLLQAGVDINRETQTGTCLHEAVIQGKADVVNYLLDCGIDVNKPNAYNQTALDIVNRLSTSKPGIKEIKDILQDVTCIEDAKAVRDYHNMSEQNHISFNEGDYVKVVEKHPSGMWKGYVIANQGPATKTGHFPSNCVLLLETKAGCKNMSGYYANGSADPRSPLAVMPNNVPDLIARQHHCHNNHADADRDSGISPQQSYPSQPLSSPQGFVRQHSPHSSTERTAEWLGRYVSIAHSDGQSNSPASSSRGSPSSSNRNSITSTNSGGYVSCHYVNSYHPGHHAYANGTANHTSSSTTQQHRLSGQSYESGVSSSHQSYHSGSSSSLGSLDRLEESGYASTVNVHELFMQGLPDHEVLRTWLTDLHFEEYYKLFIHAGYDMPTISRMTPEDLTAIGVTKPAHRKRLKAEISKLHIHDGIPEYKPGTLREWLRMLCLDEYTQTLATQGYEDVDLLTDITWEDLEDIGIKRLGHQKKMMLAIDRLRRIQNGQYKPSMDNYRGSQEMLDPSSAYPNSRYMDGQRGVSPSSNQPQTPPGDYVAHKPPRSPSLDNLVNRGSDGRGFPSREDIYAKVNQMKPHSSHYQIPVRVSGDMSAVNKNGAPIYVQSQDIIAIQVHRQANSTPTQEMEQNGGIMTSSANAHSSFQSPVRTRHSSGPGAGSEFSIYDRGAVSGDELESSSGTLTRPSTKTSPVPKPKPIVTIIAKSSRPTKPDTKSSEPNYSQFNGHSVNLAKNYSSGSLPRNASLRNKNSEHIYDLPANSYSQNSDSNHMPVIRPSLGSAPSSPHHSASFFGGSKSGKRPPPPPPKRTNSIKHGSSHLPSRPVHPVLRKMSRGDDTDTSSQSAHSDDEHHVPPQAMPLLSNNYGLNDRYGRVANHKSADSLGRKPNGEEDCPPSLAHLVNTSSHHTSAVNNSAHSPKHRYPGSTDMPSPLSDAINQLQFNASGLKSQDMSQQQQQNTQHAPMNPHLSQNGPAERPAIAEKPKHPKLQEWQDRDFDSSGSGSDSDSSRQSTLKRATSTGTVDSNTLPFANENVGTIKQRTASAKPSIVSVSSMEGEEGEGKNVELNSSVFEDYSNTDTMKRNRNYSTGECTSSSQCNQGQLSAEMKKMPPPTPTRQDSVGQPTQSAEANGANGDVLNDIGNMLQDLTDELDAMLEFDLQ